MEKSGAARWRERLITLSVIVERRASTSRWVKHRWNAVAVAPAVGDTPDWQLLSDADGVQRYHACNLHLDLHRKETEGYKVNLAGTAPAVYVLLRPTDDDDRPWQPVEVSVSAYNALSGTEVGDDQVDAVPMGPVVETLVRQFVDRHHVDQPFFKRKRKGADKKLGELSDFRPVKDLH